MRGRASFFIIVIIKNWRHSTPIYFLISGIYTLKNQLFSRENDKICGKKTTGAGRGAQVGKNS
jgi:hypothetical protein